MSFEPVAIVGRGCVFPGALDPAGLWDLIVTNRDAVSPCPEGRWRIPKERVLGEGPEQAWTDRGGYVTGFDRVFDPSGFALPAAEIARHDETLRWLLHTAREALREAGMAGPHGVPPRTGAVIGLLGLPSDAMAQYAEQVWSGAAPAVAAENRFQSGLPAHLLAQALHLDLGAFALDAACASSLYAIRLACDALHDGRADLMLAGGVNRADDLFLHIGFSTLKAISRTGRSRPFHASADGLLPAEGAGFVALKRLADAEAAGDRVLGVIRAIGVSNDGRSAGLLAPSEAGQEQALRSAYREAGLDPSAISLLECHATGTPVGDGCEIRSMARLFEGLRDIPIGSIKSNLGHPITAAGIAGLLKLLGAMEHRIRPASLHVARAAESIGDLAGSPFRLLSRNEPWEVPEVRRAGLSAFGFGGNNAHLIVEEYQPGAARRATPAPPPAKVAVVAMSASAGDAAGLEEFTQAVFRSAPRPPRVDSVALELAGIGFAPLDLASALPQQVLALQVASEALECAGALPPARTGVFVGMGCDAEVARYGLRWRRAAAGDRAADGDAICPPLTAPAVLGRLANITANRISSKFDLRGPSFAVMAEELSGVIALQLAARAVASGELDAAVVGAVDLSCEPVHETAARSVLPGRPAAADAAVFLVLKRLEDAGKGALATIEAAAERSPELADAVTPVFGHAHAASGLLHAAAGILACAHGAQAPAAPWIAGEGRRGAVRVHALGDASGTVGFAAVPGIPTRPVLLGPASGIVIYSGADRAEVLDALRRGRASSEGPARLAIVAAGEEELGIRRERARQALASSAAEFSLDGVHYRPAPVEGQLALVFPGAAAAYRGMGRTLLLAFPELLDRVTERFPRLAGAAAWTFDSAETEPDAARKLWGSSLLSQAHAEFTLRLLRLAPHAALGISSGETNSLAAFGVWRDLDRFYQEFSAAGVLDRVLGGAFEITGGSPWQVWQVALTEAELGPLLAAFPELRLTGRYAPGEYSVAGQAAVCERAIAHIGPAKTQRVNYDLVIHCPEFAPYAETWRRLHDRESSPSPVRFYTLATGTHYAPDHAAVARALRDQAGAALDFPAAVENAWNDGVRLFVEQGPQATCTARIRKILAGREHVAVSLDRAGADSLRQAANAVAQLIAAGADASMARVFERFAPPPAAEPRKFFSVRAHAAPVTIPSRAEAHRLPAVTAPPLSGADHRFSRSGNPSPPPPPGRSGGISLFESHVRALAAAHAEFLENCGAGPHEMFLDASERGYRHATGRPLLPAPAAPAPVRRVPAPVPVPAPNGKAPGLSLTRGELERLASGSIADVLGSQFRPLDQFRRVVRLPMPPLLLVDRVTEIEGRALTLGPGTIVTETDVQRDAWYMYRGRMAAGIMIEAGQSDLLLISWQGIDLDSKGERVYRLLGCDLTYHGSLPEAGDTLRYDIHIDRHARQGPVRLFFFHYDCRIGGGVRLSVRNGQAGFFTDEELATSAGVLHGPEPSASDKAAVRRFSLGQLRDAAAGRAHECFGAGFELAATHQRSPGFAAPDVVLLDAVTHLQPHAGETRGYLRAELSIRPDLWFFAGHFKNDPCMPGTLMFEGCLQAMAFYMMASGLTLERDGWRFEPVPEVPYELRCRGQVTPASRLLEYEVFVEEIRGGPEPVLFADVLCTVDGLKAFHCRRMGLRLTPGFPLDENPPAPSRDAKAVASVNGVALNYDALLHCAWGSPVAAFGPPFERFAAGRLPRLPGPPYHFVTRITEIHGEFGSERAGARVVAEYDVEPDAWFFESNPSGGMPLAALMEIGLQPCGWLACFSGIPLRAKDDLYFRNLDGTAAAGAAIRQGRGVIRTEATLVNVARSAGITLTSFDVRCTWNGAEAMRMQTTFGFFRKDELARQAGLPAAAGGLPRSRRRNRHRAGRPARPLFCRPPAPAFGQPADARPHHRARSQCSAWLGARGKGRSPLRLVFQGALLPGPGAARVTRAGGHRSGARILRNPLRSGRRHSEPGVRARWLHGVEVPRAGAAAQPAHRDRSAAEERSARRGLGGGSRRGLAPGGWNSHLPPLRFRFASGLRESAVKPRAAVVGMADAGGTLRRLLEASPEAAECDDAMALARRCLRQCDPLRCCSIEADGEGAVGQAIDAIQSGAADTAVVGGRSGALALKRFDLARAEGDTCYVLLGAEVEGPSGEEFDSGPALCEAIARAALSVCYRFLPAGPGRPLKKPWFGSATRRAWIRTSMEAGFVLMETGEPPVLPLTTFALRSLQLVTLAAATPEELAGQLDGLAAQLSGGASVRALARAAQVRAMAGAVQPYGLALLARTDADLLREIDLARQGVPRSVASGAEWKTPGGSCFTAHPLGSEGVAFVYPGVGSPYEGAGADLFALAPPLLDRFAGVARGDPGRYFHEADIYPRRPGIQTPFHSNVVALGECAISLSTVLTMLMRDIFGVQPRSALGYSFGEATMPAALGVWPEPAILADRLDSSPTFRYRLQGPMRAVREAWGISPEAPLPWQSFSARGTPAQAFAALAGEARAYLCMINSPEEVVIAGEEDACRRVLGKLGSAAIPMPIAVTMHSGPAASEFEELVRIHDLETAVGCTTVLFSCAAYAPVPVERTALARAIAGGYTKTVDFPRLVRRVYAEGARVFLELGGRRNCSTWIEKILRGRPHAAIPCDSPGQNGDVAVLRALARLFAHRVPLNLGALSARAAPWDVLP